MTDLAHVVAADGHTVELPGAYVAERSTTEAWADPSKFPTLVLEVASTTDPLAASPTWVDITGYLDSFNVTRGRAGESGGVAPGSATFVLDDPTRALEGGNLQPSRRIRLRVSSPASKPIFDGFIDNPKRVYSFERGVTWQLPCYDLFQFVAAADTVAVAEGTGNGETTGARIGRMLDLVGVPSALRDVDSGLTQCVGHSGDGSTLGEIEKAVDTEYGHAWVTADGVFTFRERHGLPESFLFVASSIGDHPPGTLTVSASLDRVATVLSVQWDGGTVAVEDAAAKGVYGPRTRSVTTMLSRETEAQALAEWRLLREATPLDHVPSLTWDRITNPATIAALLNVDLFTRCSFDRQITPATPPAAPLYLAFDMFAETITWAGAGMEISCTIGFAPFIDSGDIWTWDDPWDNTGDLVWSF